MKKLHIVDALKAGYLIDDEVYPPVAYKGARLRPTEQFDCWTSLESRLYFALVSASLPGGITAADRVIIKDLLSEFVWDAQ